MGKSGKSYIILRSCLSIFVLILIFKTDNDVEARRPKIDDHEYLEEFKDIHSKLLYPFEHHELQSSMSYVHLSYMDSTVPQVTKYFSPKMPLLGFLYDSTWASLHGFLGFNSGSTQDLNPDSFLILPFYSNCTISPYHGSESEGLAVFYSLYFHMWGRNGFALKFKQRLMLDIREGIIGAENFEPVNAIVMTWKNVSAVVAPVSSARDSHLTNTFQVVIATDGNRTYAIFNYEHLGWSLSDTGNNGPQPAFIGFNSGNGTRVFEYNPYSNSVEKARELASTGHVNGFPGRHIYRIDENIIPGQCNDEMRRLSFAPETGNMLGGTMVNVTGPCFNSSQKVTCRFAQIEVPARVIHRNRASCIMPRLFIAGYIDLSVHVEGVKGDPWEGKFFVETPNTALSHVSLEEHGVFGAVSTNLTIKWDYNLFTKNSTGLVAINLWAYHEDIGNKNPQITFVETLAVETENDGTFILNVKEFNWTSNPWITGLEVGLISVNLTRTDNQGPVNLFTPVLWSRPVPLAWYAWEIHQKYSGKLYADLNGGPLKWLEQVCTTWIHQDRPLGNFTEELPPCPCTVAQALSDQSRFVPNPVCSLFSLSLSCKHHDTYKRCFRSAFPSASGAGQECCYDAYGYLMMMDDSMWGSLPARVHEMTNVPSLSNYYNDVVPFLSCCQLQTKINQEGWSCRELRFKHRRSNTCQNYKAPGIATIFGDPHIYTFDGYEYTFNGKGEFHLVKINTASQNLNIQARFEQVRPNINATVLTTVVARKNNSSVVEIRLRPLNARWRYKLDVFVDERKVYFDGHSQKVQTFNGLVVSTPEAIKNHSRIIAMFESGTGVEVIEHLGHMMCRVYLSPMHRNQTKGLFGNWNDDRLDDLDLDLNSQAGSPKATEAVRTMEKIHKSGLKWKVKRTDSLFYYENFNLTQGYMGDNFKPELRIDPNQIIPPNSKVTTKMVMDHCESSFPCKYDYSVTGNEEAGTAAKYFQALHYNVRENLKKVTSCGPLPTPINGRKSNFKFIVGSEVLLDCDANYVLIGSRKRVCQEDGRWSISEDGPTSCTLEKVYEEAYKYKSHMDDTEHARVQSDYFGMAPWIVLLIVIGICFVAIFPMTILTHFVYKYFKTEKLKPDPLNLSMTLIDSGRTAPSNENTTDD